MGNTTKPSRGALVASLVSLGLTVALSACGSARNPDPAGSNTSPATPATTSAITTAPAQTPAAATSPSAKLTAMPIYWVAESRRSFALYREFRGIPDTGGPVSSAVSAMTRLKPLDPDYMNPWRPASRVKVSQKGNAITVDLSKDAFANTQV